MTRSIFFPLMLSAALAPMQCSRSPDDSLRREDRAGDGLWLLAEDFRAKGNQKAYESTLNFLVTRYPSSRRAGRAREELKKLHEGKLVRKPSCPSHSRRS